MDWMTMNRWRALLPAALWLLAAWNADAAPQPGDLRESVVQVVVMDGDDVRRVGSGFVAADGHVLTAAHLVQDEDRIVVVPLTGRAELVARIAYADARSDAALLTVRGLAAVPLRLAKDAFGLGRPVFSAGVWSASGTLLLVASAPSGVAVSVAEGSVGAHAELAAENGAPAVPLIEHNAMIPAAGYGGVLLNECGEVAGLNRGSPGTSARRLRRGRAPGGVVHALRAPAIASLLQAQGLQPVATSTPCIGALAAARADMEEAAAELERSRRELEDATGQAEQTREQLERAQQEKDQAAERAAEAESRVGELESRYADAVRSGDEQAESLLAELEAARGEEEAARAAVGALEGELAALGERLRQEADAERKRLIMLSAIAVLVIAAIIAAAVVAVNRRSSALAVARDAAARAQQAASDARAEARQLEAPFPDHLLTGRTEAGHPVSVKVPGRLLAGEGAVIGRSPRNSMLLIDDSTLSREHARLFGSGDSLALEDLGSTNGTRVNGGALLPGKPVPVGAGDWIEFGSVRVELLVAG